ncbi:Zinc finger protein ZAT7 [Zea mays]|jgi:ribosomal protein S26|uniref:Zinc finger protein ZAT7 n=1 Tax=Zea mays TaxID=4577 RepID=A0A3L6D9G6_MAIZE|nr:Zinc finger protein ZAT7 [Zea mays]
MAAATATERPTAASSNNNDLLRRLVLSLSLSTASKVIAKQHAQHKQHQQAAAGAFRCRTCGRAFPTFQALGGHRTSHKRSLVRARGLDLLLGARPGKGAAAARDVHRCTTCGAAFPTGQALGGHMRRHRAAAHDDEGEAAAAARAVIVNNALSSGEQQGEREVDDGARSSIRFFQFI